MAQEFCFCGLAIGKRYREFAIGLAADLRLRWRANRQHSIRGHTT